MNIFTIMLAKFSSLFKIRYFQYNIPISSNVIHYHLYARELYYLHFTQVFDSKITFLNLQHKNTNSKVDFVFNNRVLTLDLMNSGVQ